jgi:hypothetical protein
MTVRDNHERGVELEQRVEDALSDAGFNFETQQMHAGERSGGTIYVDVYLRSNDGEPVLHIECKTGDHDKPLQAQTYKELSESTSSRIVAYVTEDGTSAQFSNRVLAHYPADARFDQAGDALSKLRDAMDYVKDSNSTAMLTCRDSEIAGVCRVLVDTFEAEKVERAKAEQAAEQKAEEARAAADRVARDREERDGNEREQRERADAEQRAQEKDLNDREARERADRQPPEAPDARENRTTAEPAAASDGKESNLTIDLDPKQMAEALAERGLRPEQTPIDAASKPDAAIDRGIGLDFFESWGRSDRG